MDLNLKKKSNLNWLNCYEVLRVITNIEFLDYNLLEVNQSFHVEIGLKLFQKQI